MPTVLITRPKQQSEPLRSELERLGFEVRFQPAIEILPPEKGDEVDQSIRRLLDGEFDWIVFSSVNGVRFFADRQHELPSTVRIAVVGSGTEAAVRERFGRDADLVPVTFTAEGVTEYLRREAAQGKRFLVLRANRGREVFRRDLTEAGGIVTETIVYRSVDVKTSDPEIDALMLSGDIDFVTVTSSAIARSLIYMFDKSLLHADLVSISPITTQTLTELGFPPKYEAREASMQGIVEIFQRLCRGV